MRRLLLAALIAGLGVLLMPVPAQAGGPTSVLVTNQSLGRATALVYSDARYGELERLLTDVTPVEAPAGFPNGDWLVVTWLAHDVRVWRTHQVQLAASGRPLVATSTPDASSGDLEQSWAQVDDPAALKAVMAELGMTGKAKPGATAPGAADLTGGEPVASQPDTAAAVDAAAEPASSWFALTGWRWAVPGLLAGVLLGLAVLPTRRLVSRRSGPPGERHQLIDIPGH
jgi:hypothetical protein